MYKSASKTDLSNYAIEESPDERSENPSSKKKDHRLDQIEANKKKQSPMSNMSGLGKQFNSLNKPKSSVKQSEDGSMYGRSEENTHANIGVTGRQTGTQENQLPQNELDEQEYDEEEYYDEEDPNEQNQ